jgi:hypothetical protein
MGGEALTLPISSTTTSGTTPGLGYPLTVGAGSTTFSPRMASSAGIRSTARILSCVRFSRQARAREDKGTTLGSRRRRVSTAGVSSHLYSTTSNIGNMAWLGVLASSSARRVGWSPMIRRSRRTKSSGSTPTTIWRIRPRRAANPCMVASNRCWRGWVYAASRRRFLPAAAASRSAAATVRSCAS